jgi:clan AA aspartic protease
MLAGRVNSQRQAVVSIRLRGTTGTEVDVFAMIDSGFNGSLTLSPNLAQSLGLIARVTSDAFLADGSKQQCEICVVAIHWMGTWRTCRATIINGPTLLGMKLMEGCEIKIACVSNGLVEITPLP